MAPPQLFVWATSDSLKEQGDSTRLERWWWMCRTCWPEWNQHARARASS